MYWYIQGKALTISDSQLDSKISLNFRIILESNCHGQFDSKISLNMTITMKTALALFSKCNVRLFF